jgi:hypothetical protein
LTKKSGFLDSDDNARGSRITITVVCPISDHNNVLETIFRFIMPNTGKRCVILLFFIILRWSFNYESNVFRYNKILIDCVFGNSKLKILNFKILILFILNLWNFMKTEIFKIFWKFWNEIFKFWQKNPGFSIATVYAITFI